MYRDGQTLISTKSATPLETDASVSKDDLLAGESLGEFTLQGEIVDSKCYLGVMRPGNTKTHRACAVRCIAGGVPPVLLVRDAQGDAMYFYWWRVMVHRSMTRCWRWWRILWRSQVRWCATIISSS